MGFVFSTSTRATGAKPRSLTSIGLVMGWVRVLSFAWRQGKDQSHLVCLHELSCSLVTSIHVRQTVDYEGVMGGVLRPRIPNLFS